MKIPKLGTCIHITWLDSTTTSGWNHLDTGEATPAVPRRISTYGILTGRSGIAITVSPTVSRDVSRDGHLDPLTIPLGCILKIRRFSCG